MQSNDQTNRNFNVLKLTQMAMLAAISIVLIYFVHIPIIPGISFLKYDPADATLMIGTILYGPLAGFILTCIVSIVQGLFISGDTGIIGIIMHILATGTYVIVGGLIYSRRKGTKTLILSLICGTLAMTGSMILWNIIVTPFYLEITRQAVYNMILPVLLPFNLIKAGLNSILAFVLFMAVGKYIAPNYMSKKPV